MTLIDIHPHIISADLTRYPQVPAPGATSIWHVDRPATWEQLSEQLEIAGVDKAAVVQASTAYGHDNSYLADTLEHNSDRIVGVCSVGLTDDDVVKQMEYWINERGLSGVRQYTPRSAPTSFRLDDEHAKPALKWLAENGVSLVMTGEKEMLVQLRSVLKELPDLRVALDHAARIRFESDGPYLKDHPILEFVDVPNVFIKITTVTLLSAGENRAAARAGLKEVVSYFGSERLAWGSNWPATEGNYSDFKDLLLDAVSDLPAADAENIRSGTAIRLYPRLAG